MVLKWIDRLSEYVAKIFRWFGVALTLVTLYEVFCRYVLVRPTIWAFDVTMILNAAFFFRRALLTKQDAHIKVDVLYDKFPSQENGDFLYYAVLYIPLCVVMVWSHKVYLPVFLIRDKQYESVGTTDLALESDHPLGFLYVAARIGAVDTDFSYSQ